MTLEQVSVFEVPKHVIDDTDSAIRGAGDEGFELFALWTGRVDGQIVRVEHVYVPTQELSRREDGLQVRVPGDSLHQLNQWLYEHQQVLVAQVHSHPTDAYHSETDDAYPIVATEGALSIVLADFGLHGVVAENTVIYQLFGGGWRELSSLAAILRVV